MFPELAKCTVLLVFHGTMLPFLAFSFLSLHFPLHVPYYFWFGSASTFLMLGGSNIKNTEKILKPIQPSWIRTSFYHKMMYDTLLSCFFYFVFSFKKKNWVRWSFINQTAILYKVPQQSILLLVHTKYSITRSHLLTDTNKPGLLITRQLWNNIFRDKFEVQDTELIISCWI